MTSEEKIKELHEMLQMAVELEFATIPPYLTAAFSIHPKANRSSFSIIHSVYMEEMLHMVLAANTLNAIGGKVVLNEKTIPSYPLTLEFQGQRFKDREFEVNLERFSKDAIETFLKIELPDYWPEDIMLKAAPRMEVPGYTIGEFYNLIKTKLKELCEELTEEKVFVGDPDHQVSEAFYWSGGGKPIAVKGLKDALLAIDVIIDQGEGVSEMPLSDGDEAIFGEQNEVPHFFRFNEIYVGQKYNIDDDPLLPPTGDLMPVDWEAVHKIKKNCKASDFENTSHLMSLNTQFNRHFTLMLQGIEKAFNGHPKSLYSAIMNDMHGMAKIAYEMVQIPINGDPDGQTGSPTFEIIKLTD